MPNPEINMPPIRRGPKSGLRDYSSVPLGGLFKTEDLVKPNGRRIIVAVTGSGGQSCYDVLKRKTFGYNPTHCRPCGYNPTHCRPCII